MRIIWSKRAETDLFLEIGHIAKDSPQNALKVLQEIQYFVNDFGAFPYKYVAEPYYNDKDVRRAVIYSFKIVYKVYPDKIRILRVFNANQKPNKI